MKIIKSGTVLLFILCSFCLFSQSIVVYQSGTILEVQTGADICAGNITINGTWLGGGSICNGPLPVSISEFTSTAGKQEITLMWVTEWELNNKGFEIERQTFDPLDPGSGSPEWKKIAFVEGKGSSNVQNGYLYKDTKLRSGGYRYRLKQVDYNGSYEYYALNNDIVIEPPKEFSMSQNYPNPGNPKCKINFEIPVDGRVSVKVYDMLGREVITLIDDYRNADYYTIEFDGSNIASGVYFYRITAEGGSQKFTKTMKMIIVK